MHGVEDIGFEYLCKIFADDTSIFSKLHDTNISQINLNNDLLKVKKWTDPNKKANEV